MTKKTKQQQRPVETIRDGAIKAAIWRNEGEKGAFFSVTVARTYKGEDGELHDSDSFSGTQLLQLARVLGKAYDRAGRLARAEKAKANSEEAGEE